MTRRGANLRAVEKYVVHVRAARFPGTAGSVVETLTFTGKPESSAPHTPAGERHLDHGENSETRRLLEPIIEEWLRGRYSDSWMLIEAAPTEITAWRSAVTQEARGTAWRFDRAIAEVEREFERRNPGVRLSVVINPYHEPVSSKHRAAMQDRMVSKDKDRAEIADWVEMREGCYESRMQLMDAAAKRFSCHADTVRAAVRYRRSQEDAARIGNRNYSLNP